MKGNGREKSMSALRIVVSEEERRPFFTPATLAEYLNVSERTVRQLIAEQSIESVRVAGARRIPAEAVDAYLAKHRSKAR